MFDGLPRSRHVHSGSPNVPIKNKKCGNRPDPAFRKQSHRRFPLSAPRKETSFTDRNCQRQRFIELQTKLSFCRNSRRFVLRPGSIGTSPNPFHSDNILENPAKFKSFRPFFIRLCATISHHRSCAGVKKSFFEAILYIKCCFDPSRIAGVGRLSGGARRGYSAWGSQTRWRTRWR